MWEFAKHMFLGLVEIGKSAMLHNMGGHSGHMMTHVGVCKAYVSWFGLDWQECHAT